MMIDEGAGDAIRVDGIGRKQVLLLIIGALVVFCDGFDAQMISATGPAISADWHLARAALAPVFAANLAGLMIGALAITPLADLFSRKLIIMVCVALFGVLSLLPVFASNLLELGGIRFATGLALGAAMPSMIAAASEWVPRHVRTRIVVALSAAFSLGFALCGVATSLMVGAHGWRSMFWLGAVLPLLTLPLLAAWFPESPTYLVSRGRVDALRSLLARMGPGVAYDPTGAKPAMRQSFPVRALFQEGRTPVTLLIWCAYFCSGATLYFLVNWLPLLVNAAGFGVDQSALSSTFYQVGGLTAGFLVGYLVDRWGVVALAVWLLAASVGVALVGLASSSLSMILGGSFLAGAFVVGGQNTLNAYTGGQLYPSRIRATGLGWALAMVRLGGVLAGSLGAGFVISLDLGPRNTFMIIGAPEILGGLALLGISMLTRQAAVAVAAE